MIQKLSKKKEWFLYDKTSFKKVTIEINDKDIKFDNICLKYFNNIEKNILEIFTVDPKNFCHLSLINSRELFYVEYFNNDIICTARLL